MSLSSNIVKNLIVPPTISTVLGLYALLRCFNDIFDFLFVVLYLRVHGGRITSDVVIIQLFVLQLFHLYGHWNIEQPLPWLHLETPTELLSPEYHFNYLSSEIASMRIVKKSSFWMIIRTLLDICR